MKNPEGADEGSTGEYSLDEDDQLQPEDTLIDRGVDDVLDEGISPPEAPRGMDRSGTAGDQQDESLDGMLAEEEPDPAMEIDEPLDADDRWRSDASEEATEFPRREEVGGARAGRLVAPDEGAGPDEDSELYGDDVGIDGGAASAEEAAVHLFDEE